MRHLGHIELLKFDNKLRLFVNVNGFGTEALRYA